MFATFLQLPYYFWYNNGILRLSTENGIAQQLTFGLSTEQRLQQYASRWPTSIIKSRHSHRFGEVDPEICKTRVLREPLSLTRHRGVFFFPLDIWSYIFLWIFELQGIRNLPGVKKQSKKHLSWTSRQGLTQHVCKNSGSNSKQRREHLGFCAGKSVICVLYLVVAF